MKRPRSLKSNEESLKRRKLNEHGSIWDWVEESGKRPPAVKDLLENLVKYGLNTDSFTIEQYKLVLWKSLAFPPKMPMTEVNVERNAWMSAYVTPLENFKLASLLEPFCNGVSYGGGLIREIATPHTETRFFVVTKEVDFYYDGEYIGNDDKAKKARERYRQELDGNYYDGTPTI